MGKRDYGRREPKKAKKAAKRSESVSELLATPEVEVIRKKRKRAGEGETE